MIFLILVLFGLRTPQSDQPYELKGDVPGMTLKQFKTNHKHADCTRQSETLQRCHIADDVSFGGVPSSSFKGCTLPICAFQGISADFVNGKMVRLRYSVSPGGASRIIPALKMKFGEPTTATTSSATWKNSVATLTVFDAKGMQNHPETGSTEIVSYLNDQGESKDI
jgi:hypothetical protein